MGQPKALLPARAGHTFVSQLAERCRKAGLMPPLAAAGLPPLAGGLTGLIALLYQEDG